MRLFFRFFMLFAVVVVIGIAVIKFIQGCSWKDAVGIGEEFLKEI